MKLENLYSIIKDRIKRKPKRSYVVSLLEKGEDRIIQKVGEEAVEVVVAAKGESKQRIIEEIADLYFMTLVLMASKKITPNKIYEELEKRRK